MTAFASNILAALPGVGAKIGAGQGVGMGEEAAAGGGSGFEAVFAALLAASSETTDGAKASLAGSTTEPSEAVGVPSDALLAEAMLVAPQMLAAQPQPAAESDAIPAQSAASAGVDASAVVSTADGEVAVPPVVTSEAAQAFATPAIPVDVEIAPPAPVAAAVPTVATVAAPSVSPAVAGDRPSPKGPATASRPDTPVFQGNHPGEAAAKAAAPAAPAEAAQVTADPGPIAAAAPASAPPLPAEVARALSSAPVVLAVASTQPVASSEKAEREAAVEPSTADGAALAPEDVVGVPELLPEPAAPAAETVAQAPVAEAPARSTLAAEPKRVAGLFDTRAVAEAVEPEALREVNGDAAAGEARPQAADLASRAVSADPDTGLPSPAAAPEHTADTPAAEPAPAVQSAAATQGAEAPAEVRGSPETVAKLASDIVRKLDGKTTKFDLQLDPLGLGKVDVSVEINADGRLSAVLSFDSAQAANELRGRSAELRQALQQAGFDVADNSLSFDLSSQGGGFGGRDAGQQDARPWSGRAFQTAQAGLDEADARLAAASTYSRTPSGGVDIRI